MTAEDRQAIDQRTELIAARAMALAAEAIDNKAPWTRRLGDRPMDARVREEWLSAVATVAAYRDCYKVTSDLPAGGGASTQAQAADRQRALLGVRHAVRLSGSADSRSRARCEIPAISAP